MSVLEIIDIIIIIIIIINLFSSQFYQISFVVKLLLNHSSLSLRVPLHIFPSISHSHLRVLDTNFTFQNFRLCTQKEQRRHTIVIALVWKY
jgi:hypothetical protein